MIEIKGKNVTLPITLLFSAMVFYFHYRVDRVEGAQKELEGALKEKIERERYLSDMADIKEDVKYIRSRIDRLK